MGDHKKILVSLPPATVAEIDAAAKSDGKNRSALIREALSFYLRERRRDALRRQMEEGYREMGKLNLEIARSWFSTETEAFLAYEENLH